MSEKLEEYIIPFEDNRMWKSKAFKNNKYFFNDVGNPNYFDAILEMYDMVQNAQIN